MEHSVEPEVSTLVTPKLIIETNSIGCSLTLAVDLIDI
jgi:hypothetical protein